MAVKWDPSGNLNIAADPTELPEDSTKALVYKKQVSGAMTRCTNLHLNRPGIASTRFGSAKLNATAIDQDIRRIIEEGGIRYTFAGGQVYRNEASIGSGLENAATSAILYNPYQSTTQSVFALNGVDRKRIDGVDVFEWGIDAPTVKPTAATGASTTLTGDYYVKYTYCRKEGSVVVVESNPSPVSDKIALSSQSLLTTWTASADPQVTHVRIYRTVADGTIYLHDQDVAVGTTSLDTTTTDLALGTAAATNHDRPPVGSQIIGPSFGGYCFIVKDNLLYYSLSQQPEYWPALYYLEVSPIQLPLISGCFYAGQIYVASQTDIYQIQGTGPESFFPFSISAITGTQSANCFLSIQGIGLVHLGNDGIYAFTGGKDNNLTDMGLEPLFRGITVGSVTGMNKTYIANCWMFQHRGHLYFAYPGIGSIHCDNMIVIDLATLRPKHYQYAATFRSFAVDYSNDWILAGDTSGYVWKIEVDSLTDDNGTAISWQVESKEFNSLRKYFPRYARYDVTLGTGATANGYVLMDNVAKQTHALTTSRNTRKRLVAGCTGDRMSVRISGTGQVDIYGAEIE